MNLIKFENIFHNYKNISIDFDSFNTNNNNIKCLNLSNIKIREKVVFNS